VAVITSSTIVFGYGLNTGGPVLMTWGWLIGSFFTIMVGLSLAEICSAYPQAGSVYYWGGVLAPRKWRACSAFVCGWFNLMGNVAASASFAYGLA